jgi:hypothetical protein
MKNIDEARDAYEARHEPDPGRSDRSGKTAR